MRVTFGSFLVSSLWRRSGVVQPLKRCGRFTLCLKYQVFISHRPTLQLFSRYQLKAHFLYSITIYMLHYNPQQVSSSTLLIFGRTDCIITASGIVTVCKRPYSMLVESGLQSTLNRLTVRPFTDSDDTRGCNNTICPPEDEQGITRNMLRIIM